MDRASEDLDTIQLSGSSAIGRQVKRYRRCQEDLMCSDRLPTSEMPVLTRRSTESNLATREYQHGGRINFLKTLSLSCSKLHLVNEFVGKQDEEEEKEKARGEEDDYDVGTFTTVHFKSPEVVTRKTFGSRRPSKKHKAELLIFGRTNPISNHSISTFDRSTEDRETKEIGRNEISSPGFEKLHQSISTDQWTLRKIEEFSNCSTNSQTAASAILFSANQNKSNDASKSTENQYYFNIDSLDPDFFERNKAVTGRRRSDDVAELRLSSPQENERIQTDREMVVVLQCKSIDTLIRSETRNSHESTTFNRLLKKDCCTSNAAAEMSSEAVSFLISLPDDEAVGSNECSYLESNLEIVEPACDESEISKPWSIFKSDVSNNSHLTSIYTTPHRSDDVNYCAEGVSLNADEKNIFDETSSLIRSHFEVPLESVADSADVGSNTSSTFGRSNEETLGQKSRPKPSTRNSNTQTSTSLEDLFVKMKIESEIEKWRKRIQLTYVEPQESSSRKSLAATGSNEGIENEDHIVKKLIQTALEKMHRPMPAPNATFKTPDDANGSRIPRRKFTWLKSRPSKQSSCEKTASNLSNISEHVKTTDEENSLPVALENKTNSDSHLLPETGQNTTDDVILDSGTQSDILEVRPIYATEHNYRQFDRHDLNRSREINGDFPDVVDDVMSDNGDAIDDVISETDVTVEDSAIGNEGSVFENDDNNNNSNNRKNLISDVIEDFIREDYNMEIPSDENENKAIDHLDTGDKVDAFSPDRLNHITVCRRAGHFRPPSTLDDLVGANDLDLDLDDDPYGPIIEERIRTYDSLLRLEYLSQEWQRLVEGVLQSGIAQTDRQLRQLDLEELTRDDDDDSFGRDEYLLPPPQEVATFQPLSRSGFSCDYFDSYSRPTESDRRRANSKNHSLSQDPCRKALKQPPREGRPFRPINSRYHSGSSISSRSYSKFSFLENSTRSLQENGSLTRVQNSPFANESVGRDRAKYLPLDRSCEIERTVNEESICCNGISVWKRYHGNRNNNPFLEETASNEQSNTTSYASLNTGIYSIY